MPTEEIEIETFEIPGEFAAVGMTRENGLVLMGAWVEKEHPGAWEQSGMIMRGEWLNNPENLKDKHGHDTPAQVVAATAILGSLLRFMIEYGIPFPYLAQAVDPDMLRAVGLQVVPVSQTTMSPYL